MLSEAIHQRASVLRPLEHVVNLAHLDIRVGKRAGYRQALHYLRTDLTERSHGVPVEELVIAGPLPSAFRYGRHVIKINGMGRWWMVCGSPIPGWPNDPQPWTWDTLDYTCWRNDVPTGYEEGTGTWDESWRGRHTHVHHFTFANYGLDVTVDHVVNNW